MKMSLHYITRLRFVGKKIITKYTHTRSIRCYRVQLNELPQLVNSPFSCPRACIHSCSSSVNSCILRLPILHGWSSPPIKKQSSKTPCQSLSLFVPFRDPLTLQFLPLKSARTGRKIRSGNMKHLDASGRHCFALTNSRFPSGAHPH